MHPTTSFDWTQAYPPGVEPAWDVALLFPPQGGWTLDEYFELSERTNQLVEFTRGRIEVLEMPTVEHQRILMFLIEMFRKTGVDDQQGFALVAPHPTKILPEVVREPDIVFKLRENLSAKDKKYFQGADLVMEIVSPDAKSHKRDYETKVADYAAAGISEYWIVDPQEKKITVLTLDGDKYQEHGVATTGNASSKLLKGFSVDAPSVFAAGVLPSGD